MENIRINSININTDIIKGLLDLLDRIDYRYANGKDYDNLDVCVADKVKYIRKLIRENNKENNK